MINGILKKALTTLIDQKLRGAGKVSELDFDRKAGMLSMSLDLRGEEGAVSVTLNGLSLSQDGKLSFATAESNRVWIRELLNSYSDRLVVDISEKYLAIVRPMFTEK